MAPYVLLSADKSPVRRFLAVFGIGLEAFWMTHRFPFCQARITHPPSARNPALQINVLRHESFHVEQLRPWYGPLWSFLLVSLLPLPVLFSGRWFLERWPYLDDIRQGRRTVDDVVHILWSSYWWAWPPFLMRRWFEQQLTGQARRP
jgi:hypothetical protein